MGLIEAFKQLPKQGERIYFPLSLSVVAGYYGTDDRKPKSAIHRIGTRLWWDINEYKDLNPIPSVLAPIGSPDQ